MPRQRQYRENDDVAAGLRRLVTAYLRRVGDGDADDLVELARLAEQVNSALAEAVTRQREQGASWTEIGRALGVTRQAAQKRFGDPERPGLRVVGGQPAHLR